MPCLNKSSLLIKTAHAISIAKTVNALGIYIGNFT